jgi:hypothetical protein
MVQVVNAAQRQRGPHCDPSCCKLRPGTLTADCHTSDQTHQSASAMAPGLTCSKAAPRCLACLHAVRGIADARLCSLQQVVRKHCFCRCTSQQRRLRMPAAATTCTSRQLLCCGPRLVKHLHRLVQLVAILCHGKLVQWTNVEQGQCLDSIRAKATPFDLTSNHLIAVLTARHPAAGLGLPHAGLGSI